MYNHPISNILKFPNVSSQTREQKWKADKNYSCPSKYLVSFPDELVYNNFLRTRTSSFLWN